jgi:transposase
VQIEWFGMVRMEIVSGIERRRRWSDETKLRILAEADQPGARIGEVARRYDIMPGQIRYWRKTFSTFDAPTAFVPVNVVDGGGIGRGGRVVDTRRAATSPEVVEISLRNGRSLKAPIDIDLRMLSSLIACVEAA